MTRTLVVTRSFLSVGKPGSTVTMEELGWTDETFDEFLDAGHGMEIHPPTVSTAPTVQVTPAPKTKAKAKPKADPETS